MPRNEHFLPRNNGNRSESIPRNFFGTKFRSQPYCCTKAAAPVAAVSVAAALTVASVVAAPVAASLVAAIHMAAVPVSASLYKFC
jgi:hypothetical protein